MTGDMQLGADPPPTSVGFRGRYLGSPGRGSPFLRRARRSCSRPVGEAGRLSQLRTTSDLLLQVCSVFPPRPRGEGELPA